MAKDFERKAQYDENEVVIYKGSLPQIGDTIIICGDVDCSYSQGEKARYIRAIPVLINGVPNVLSLSSWVNQACEGNNAFPQCAGNATRTIFSASCWSELRQLGGTPMKVTAHHPLICWGSRKKSTYRWTTIQCEWIDGADHKFTDQEKNLLVELIALDQSKA